MLHSKRKMVFTALMVIVLALIAGSVFAQSTATNTVSFNNIRFSYESSFASDVTIRTFAGDVANIDFAPQPPYTQFSLFSTTPETTDVESTLTITVYRLGDVAAYEESQAVVDALRDVLATRPDLSAFEVGNVEDNANDLPYLPIIPSSQIIRAITSYIVTPALSGVAFVGSYRGDVSPFNSGDFFYTVQAISADSTYYISAQLNFSTDLFADETPADFDFDAFTADLEAYLNESISAIKTAPSTSFTPPLDALTTVINTMSFGSDSTRSEPDVPESAGVVAPTDVVNTDATLGGLVGGWTLSGFGATGTESSALSEAPITIEFSEQGVSGNAGCNRFTGNFTYVQGTLVISPLATTRMACEEPLMTQEMEFLTALQSAQLFQVDTGGTLVLTYDGGTLTFNRSE